MTTFPPDTVECSSLKANRMGTALMPHIGFLK